MENLVSVLYLRHRNFWANYKLTFLVGLLFFLVALLVQHVSYAYIEHRVVGIPVEDILLDNLPMVNFGIFIVQGVLLLTFVVIGLMVAYPRYIPFALKSLALFIIVRSFFIALTHLGANLNQLALNENGIGFGLYDFLYNAKNDFFFSGHVGTPFILAFIFWHKKPWRYFFFTCSVVLGISMILAHMHYSIDVFAAPFIAYGIFILATKIFPADFRLTTN